MSSPLHDAVIVGGGAAGCTAAILLARGGWRVALVERHTFPRRKVCGECIAASNLPLLQALGIGAAVDTAAGEDLRRVTLLHGARAVSAALPAAAPAGQRWGRALGRETLDTLLLEQARAAGAEILQPWSLQAMGGAPGDWRCSVRSQATARERTLHAAVVVDAHGSWEDTAGLGGRRVHRSSDLLAFKANFSGAAHPADTIGVLALAGGYGGIVVADGGLATLACCVRRDRLRALREAAPGLSAGEAVQRWLTEQCRGVADALHGARREGPWLASGPLAPGIRVGTADGLFRIGNAAGEAHPILGEGISMALQSGALLAQRLLRAGPPTGSQAPSSYGAVHAEYAAAWRRAFAPRLRLAALFAHAAMRPAGAAALMALAAAWPPLLTRGARWGGKTRMAGSLPSGETT